MGENRLLRRFRLLAAMSSPIDMRCFCRSSPVPLHPAAVLRNDPDDVAASRALAAEMQAVDDALRSVLALD